MGLIMITHDLGVVAETVDPRRRDVWRQGHGRGPRRRYLRRSMSSLHNRADGLDSGAGRVAGRRLVEISRADRPTRPIRPRAARSIRVARRPMRNAPPRLPAFRPIGRGGAARPAGGWHDGPRAASRRLPALELAGIGKTFTLKEGSGLLFRGVARCRRVRDVDLVLPPRATRSRVWWGESGSGKTTTGMMALRLTEPTQPAPSRLGGEDITTLGMAELKPFRRRMQVVFQDSYSALRSDVHARADRGRTSCDPRGRVRRRNRRNARWTGWSAWACTAATATATRTSCRAANASGWQSPAR